MTQILIGMASPQGIQNIMKGGVEFNRDTELMAPPVLYCIPTHFLSDMWCYTWYQLLPVRLQMVITGPVVHPKSSKQGKCCFQSEWNKSATKGFQYGWISLQYDQFIYWWQYLVPLQARGKISVHNLSVFWKYFHYIFNTRVYKS